MPATRTRKAADDSAKARHDAVSCHKFFGFPAGSFITTTITSMNSLKTIPAPVKAQSMPI